MQKNLFPYAIVRQGGLSVKNIIDALPAIGESLLCVRKSETEYVFHKSNLLGALDEALQNINLSVALRTKVYNARKRVYQDRAVDFLVLATDLAGLGSDFATTLAAAAGAAQAKMASKAAFEQAWKGNLRQSSSNIIQLALHAEDFQRGLLFSSHDLLSSVMHHSDRDYANKKSRQLSVSLLHYLSRAALKTSPLSRFTTVQFVSLEGENTSETSPPLFDHFIYAPNVAILEVIYPFLWSDAAYYRKQKLKLNGCITSAMDEALQFFFFNGKDEVCQSLQSDDVLSDLIAEFLSKDRCLDFVAACSFLESVVESVPDALEAFLLQLIDIGLLQWVLPELGLDAKWCARMLQHLAYYPDSAAAMATMHLLYGIHQSSRAFSYMTKEEVMATQVRLALQLEDFCKMHQLVVLPITPEYFWYEDASKHHQLPIDKQELMALQDELTAMVRSWPAIPISGMHASMLDFFKANYAQGSSEIEVPFVVFAKHFLSENWLPNIQRAWQWGSQPMENYRYGLLFQVFRANGQPQAVMNAAFGGGGKLFGRFLAAVPSHVTAQLKVWNQLHGKAEEILHTQGSWTGYFNANFTPLLCPYEIDMHGSRSRSQGIPLGLINIRLHKGKGALELVHATSAQIIQIHDIALEAPETKPPAVQLLYHLGVQYCSVEVFRDCYNDRNATAAGQPRISMQNWVFQRQTWRLSFADWAPLTKVKDHQFLLNFSQKMQEIGAPERFFVKHGNEKPQYCDTTNALSVLSIEKSMLKWHSSSLQTDIQIVEMLPDCASEPQTVVTEFAVECKVY